MKNKPILASDSFLLKGTRYPNAISTKFDNRRVTVIKLDDGFGVEFRSIPKDSDSIKAKSRIILGVTSKIVHGKMLVTQLKLTKEAAEILMLSLADQMGFKIYYTEKNH